MDEWHPSPYDRPRRTNRRRRLNRWITRLVVVGEGTQEANLRRLAEDLSVADRVTFEGAATDERLLALYAGALGVVYAPFDEDYGYVTLESFFSQKPVLCAMDSVGTLEFVVDGQNGFVVEPGNDRQLYQHVADRFPVCPDGKTRSIGKAGRETG